MTVRPGLTVRDSQILDMLLAGVPKTFVTERGLYRRAWNAGDVERVAAQFRVRPTNNRWSPPPVSGEVATVTIPPRVAMVLNGVCQGLTNAQIASVMTISEDTVKTQMKNLLRLLGARDRAHAAALACAGQVDIIIGFQRKSPGRSTAVDKAA